MRKIILALLIISMVGCGSCAYPDQLAEPLYVSSLFVNGVAVVPGGSGDVVGPAGATDEAIARYNLATGKLIQNSGVTIDDFDNLDTNGGDVDGFDINAGNDVNVTNDLDVDDDANVDGDLVVDGAITEGGNGVLNISDVDDTPVNGATTDPISSNWAFDHNADITTKHLPAQAGNAGKFLTTDASVASWATVPSTTVEDTPVDGHTTQAISSNWAYDHSGGGLYGINVQSLAGNITLTAGTDVIYQNLNPGGFSRNVTLATAGVASGSRFVIRNTASYNSSSVLRIYQGGSQVNGAQACSTTIEYVFDGTNWNMPYFDTLGTDPSVSIGKAALAYNYSIAAGTNSDAYNSSAAFGYSAEADNYSVAIGKNAYAYEYDIAIGYDTDAGSLKYSQALGYRSKIIRSAETSVNIDGNSSQKNNAIQVRLTKSTTNNTPAEMLCGGVAAQRITIRASSAFAFDGKVVARDNVANEVASYTIKGLIKRDASNNTVLSYSSVTVDYEDDAAWDCTLSADDTNEALVITVTGDGTNPVQWAAVVNGVETHF